MAATADERLEARTDGEPGRGRWWQQPAGRLPLWAWAGVTIAVVFFVLGFGAWWTYGRGGQVPAVSGFYAGQKVTFIHTEASDANVAQRLSGMVSSPVLVVSELAKVPTSVLGNVYVFTNDIKGPAQPRRHGRKHHGRLRRLGCPLPVSATPRPCTSTGPSIRSKASTKRGGSERPWGGDLGHGSCQPEAGGGFIGR
jgi:hypothetical protein